MYYKVEGSYGYQNPEGKGDEGWSYPGRCRILSRYPSFHPSQFYFHAQELKGYNSLSFLLDCVPRFSGPSIFLFTRRMVCGRLP